MSYKLKIGNRATVKLTGGGLAVLRRAQAIVDQLCDDDGFTKPSVMRREAKRLRQCLAAMEAAIDPPPPAKRTYTMATLPRAEEWPDHPVFVSDGRPGMAIANVGVIGAGGIVLRYDGKLTHPGDTSA
jgi:hypothetical protein